MTKQTEITKYSSDNPNPIDKYVGGRIRLRRTMLGMSQEKLADGLGVTFQQVQKYENATNRVGASRLYSIAKVLGVSTTFFYEGLENNVTPDSFDSELAKNINELGLTKELIESKRSLKLLRLFYSIDSKQVQNAMFDAIKAASKAELPED